MSGALLLSLTALLAAPPLGGDDGERARRLAAAREIMQAARYCVFTTLDAGGHPVGRMMDPFEPEEDFTVWMATNSSTRKVAHIAADPRSSLTCFDPGAVAYVTLVGRATTVDDAGERERRFKPEWGDFYRDRHRGDDYLLIRFRPVRLEIVSIAHGIAADPMAWKAATVLFDEDP